MMNFLSSQIKPLGRLFLQAGEAWLTDKAPRLSAALAFFTMLSLSPLLLTATSVAGFFYETSEAKAELVDQVQNLIGPEGAGIVRTALENAQFSRDSSILSAIIAAGLLLFTSTAVFIHLQDALNKVWSVNPEDIHMSFGKRILVVRARSLAMVLTIGFLLVVSLMVNAVLSVVQQELQEIWSELDLLVTLLYMFLNITILGGLFSLMFRFLPDADVDTKASLLGGVSTVILLSMGKWGIGLYIGNSAIGSAYGAAGSLVAFLLWIYYSMLVFFFGAEFTHALSEDRLSRKRASCQG